MLTTMNKKYKEDKVQILPGVSSKWKFGSTIMLFIVMLAIFNGSCTKDFEEINTNPQGFTTANDGALFNSLIQSLVLTGNEQFYINNDILYKQSQLAALATDAWGTYSIGTSELWKNYYEKLPIVRELEKRFNGYPSTAGYNNMRAMVKIILAYKTFKMTDLFGDIPFSDAGYGFQNIEKLHPKYDLQRDIYISQLESLKDAASLIDDTARLVEPFKTFVSFDKLFRGDLLIWKKFANSLRLRYAMRMADKEPEIAGEIVNDIITNKLPVLEGYGLTGPVLESACIWPAAAGFKNTSLNWSFREHNGLRMGSNLWHQLSDGDDPSGNDIIDPRAFVFFETNGDNQWVAFPQVPPAGTPSAGGVPYGEHRDDMGNFTIKGSNCNYSFFNYFLIRDEDFMPIILMTGAEVHFLKAEAYIRGIGVAQNLDEGDNEYMNGVNASVSWWVDVANHSSLPLSGAKFTDLLPLPSNLSASTVLNRFGSWNAANDQDRLRFLYTQMWIDLFRQPWEAYALCRRTNLLPREGDAINHFRLPYPTTELEFNSANCAEAVARQGGNDFSVRMWWNSL